VTPSRPDTLEGDRLRPPTRGSAATVFDTLSDRLAATFKSLRGKGRLSEADIDATAREIRIALLEADVALPAVRAFIANVKQRATGVEVSQAVGADRKTTLVAHTVGDLVAQATDITSTGADDVLAAASTIAAPFPVSNLKITISSVCIDSTGRIATIAWSRASANATARSGTVTSSIDSRLMVAGTSLIWGEASYDYRPTIGWTITGTLTMNDKTFLRPRLGKSVTLNSASGCP